MNEVHLYAENSLSALQAYTTWQSSPVKFYMVMNFPMHYNIFQSFKIEQWIDLKLSFIIHDNICWLVHKKYHPNDIKYHMTPNLIFSVVFVACHVFNTEF
jgi:hypothetical protein